MTSLHPVATTMLKIEEELNRQFLERREVIRAMILAILANEHCFIYGPPGTAKSFLTRSLFKRILGIKYFEAVLSKTRPAEAILGPYDIPELRDHGHLYRKWKGFLPDCDYAMLDEIGKMSPTLGHDLLPVILERLLHQVNGGRSSIQLPLRTVIGGSNELPTAESDDAAALWDRMLVRVPVEDIQDRANFVSLMEHGAPEPANPTTIDFPDLADAVDKEIPQIKIPMDVLVALAELRDVLAGDEIFPSGRRWTQSRRLLQASAFLEGHAEVTTDDLAVLRFVLWDNPTQFNTVERRTLSVSNPLAEAALEIMSRLGELRAELKKTEGLSRENKAQSILEIGTRNKEVVRDISKLKQQALAKGASVTKIEEVEAVARELNSKMMAELGLSA